MAPSSWQPDPTGRHQYRWWDGERWTHHVGDDGVAASDPDAGLDDLPAPTEGASARYDATQLTGRKATLGDGQTVTLASPGARLGAFLIDGLLLTLIALPVVLPLVLAADFQDGFDNEEVETWSDFWADTSVGIGWPTSGLDWFFFLFATVIFLVYEVSFIATKGQTPGKMAAGIRVVAAESGALPGFRKALRRWAIPGLVALVPVVGWLLVYVCYLSLTWGRDRKGWHDHVAGTMVVRTDRASHSRARWGRTASGQPVLLATPGARLGARIVDWQVMVLIWAVLLIPTVVIFVVLDVNRSPTSFLFLLLLPAVATGLVYEVVMTAVWGQTLGKMAMGIQVVRSSDGSAPGSATSFGRWALPGLALIVPVIGWLFSLLCYLSPTWGNEHQGWHDKQADTFVVVK
ncbi:RDD family protein [Candidatus Poriferisocius sp.]|uniref:RDD family protein n=1 Tax=Candidatus Poriferisocius sp. TaxID=3101276 RepID=UPI003B5CAC32